MGPDGYGCVQSGELRISAHVTVGKVDYKFSPGGIVDQRGVSVHFEENLINELQIRRSLRQPAHGPSFSLQPDYAIWLPGVDHVPPGSEMHCVYTGQSVSYGPYNSEYWVVLRQVQRSDRTVFERVGVMQPPQMVLRRGDWQDLCLV